MSEQGEMTVEQRAELIGWKEGGPKSAGEFLSAREDHLGAANADIKKLETEIGTMRNTMTGMDNTMNSMVKFFEKNQQTARQQGYKQAIDEQKTKMRAAADTGDTDAFDEADKKVTALEAQRDKEPEVSIVEEKSSPLVDTVKAHALKNPEIFATAAQRDAWTVELKYHGETGIPFEQAMEAADRAVVKQFDLTRTMPGPSGGGEAEGGGDATEFGQIPQADKDVYARMHKEYGKDYTKEKFMEQYNA